MIAMLFHVCRRSRFVFAAAALSGLLLTGLLPVSVWASKTDLADSLVSREKAPLYLTLGKADILEVEGAVSDVLVANPSIVDVTAVQANRLYVVGLSIGDTNIIALDEEGNVIKRLDVHVTYDLDAVRGLVARLFPDESVDINAIQNQIMLTGNVSTPEVAGKVEGVVSGYAQNLPGGAGGVVANMMGVHGEQQVMLQVRIVEAGRSVIRELGIETDLNDDRELSVERIFDQVPSESQIGTNNLDPIIDPAELRFRTGGGIALSQTATALGSAIFDSGLSGVGTVGLFLNALEDENLVNILAEPNLTAVSGEQAGFLAGGEFPVPAGRDQVGNLVIQFRNFGVSLNFRPTVLSNDRISLQLNTEVSSLDFDNALPAGDNAIVPGLDIRRASTTVEISSGASLMIAGLLQSETVEGMSGLPGIADTPVLGDLVKSESFQRDETELIVIVTAYLVEPYKEQETVEKHPQHRNNPLATLFAGNVRRSFNLEDGELFTSDQKYGYLID